jgi:type II secretory pathway pseudopilin PulG
MKKKYLWGLAIVSIFTVLAIILFLYSQNNPKRRDTRLSKNENHLYAIAKKISIYYLSNGKLPADLPTLIEKGWLSKKDIIDDWNSKENIKYIPLKGLEFKLRTTGPDRKIIPMGPF